MAEAQGAPPERPPFEAAVQFVYPDEDDNRLSIVDVAISLLRHWRLLVLGPIVGAILGAALTFGVGARYVAESRFMPQANEPRASQFAGLAAQFGITLGGFGGAESPDVYARLLRTRQLMQDALLTTYRIPTPDGSDTMTTTLLDLYDIQSPDQQKRTLEGVKALNEDIAVITDSKAGILTIVTRTKWLALSEQLNRRLLDLVNQFNLEKRQSSAAAERRFVEERLVDAQRDLEAAEGELARFSDRNREWRGSSQLSAENNRLQRRVDLRQQVYVSLAQAYEQARIEEVRNTSVITIMDVPEGSGIRDRGLKRRVMVGFALGFVVALGVVALRAYVARGRREHPDEFLELEAVGRDVARQLRRGRLLGKVGR